MACYRSSDRHFPVVSPHDLVVIGLIALSLRSSGPIAKEVRQYIYIVSIGLYPIGKGCPCWCLAVSRLAWLVGQWRARGGCH